MKVKWSPRAFSEVDQLLAYLITTWNKPVADNFLNKIEATIQLIKKQPLLYPATETHKNVRRCVLSKHASLYYRVKPDTIEIITLFDTRQHPEKKKL